MIAGRAEGLAFNFNKAWCRKNGREQCFGFHHQGCDKDIVFLKKRPERLQRREGTQESSSIHSYAAEGASGLERDGLSNI